MQAFGQVNDLSNISPSYTASPCNNLSSRKKKTTKNPNKENPLPLVHFLDHQCYNNYTTLFSQSLKPAMKLVGVLPS